MAEKLILELQKLEEYSGISMESIYEMLEKQASVHLIYDILGIVGCIVLLCLGVFAILHFRKKEKETRGRYFIINDDYESLKIISSIATTFIAGISLFLIPFCVADIIQMIVNKPAWILEYLTKLIK